MILTIFVVEKLSWFRHSVQILLYFMEMEIIDLRVLRLLFFFISVMQFGSIPLPRQTVRSYKTSVTNVRPEMSGDSKRPLTERP
jgi:hypothetical protein